MKNTDDAWIKSQSGRPPEWYAERTDHMRGFMTAERAAALERTLALRTRRMTVCTENTFHPQNASALVRTCEAFGLQDIHTIEGVCRFNPNLDIVRGADKWIDIHRHASTPAAVSALKGAGYRIVATSPHGKGVVPGGFDVGTGRFALVFGTEHAGVSEEVAASADEFVRIPMYGFVESLNVSASAAILICILAERLRSGASDWRLTDAEACELRFRWSMYSVRDSVAILRKRFGSGE